MARLPGCNHLFHRECIREWLLKEKGCCAVCRGDVRGQVTRLLVIN